MSLRIAIATNNNKGLEDTISSEFGHSKTFTIIEIKEKEIKNPANKLNYGRGAIVAKHLANMKIDMIISGELGPGASIILDQFNIKKLIVKHGQKVIDVLKEKALIR